MIHFHLWVAYREVADIFGGSFGIGTRPFMNEGSIRAGLSKLIVAIKLLIQ